MKCYAFVAVGGGGDAAERAEADGRRVELRDRHVRAQRGAEEEVRGNMPSKVY